MSTFLYLTTPKQLYIFLASDRMTALIKVRGIGYEHNEEIEVPEGDKQEITATRSTSLHPALKLKGVPLPRPDLLVIRMGTDDQRSKTDFVQLLPETANQEAWRQDVGVIVRIGDAVNAKSIWSLFKDSDRDHAEVKPDGLHLGDKVLTARASGDVYFVTDQYTNEQVQHRIISPMSILAVLEGSK